MGKRVVILLVCLAASCRADTSGGYSGISARPLDHGGPAAACALSASFDGRSYLGRRTVVEPEVGEALGIAVIPGCNDTGQPTEPPLGGGVQVFAIDGIDPGLAMTSADGIVWVWDGIGKMPGDIAVLFREPVCTEGTTIEFRGTWLGIIEPNGETELDLEPPYDVTVQIRETDDPSFRNTETVIRVPPTLGKPLDKEDIHASLWNAGDLAGTALCGGGRLTATAVRAFAP